MLCVHLNICLMLSLFPSISLLAPPLLRLHLHLSVPSILSRSIPAFIFSYVLLLPPVPPLSLLPFIYLYLLFLNLLYSFFYFSQPLTTMSSFSVRTRNIFSLYLFEVFSVPLVPVPAPAPVPTPEDRVEEDAAAAATAAALWELDDDLTGVEGGKGREGSISSTCNK